MIRASIELLSTSDKDRPRGVKPSDSTETDTDAESSTSNQAGDDGNSGQSEAKRPKLRTSSQDKEDAMLPDLKPAPGA